MRIIGGVLAAFVAASVWAADAGPLSPRDAGGGLKDALIQGAQSAVAALGKTDGFLDNPRVRIELPATLEKVDGVLRNVGLGKYGDQLVETMNHAAEAAVPEAKAILVDSVKKMSIQDAHAILTGPDDAATQYLRRTAGEQLRTRFQPIVHKATSKLALAEKYDQYAGKAARFGLLAEKDANLDRYVTEKALDGLFLMMAEQEKAIRANPAGAATSLARKVFGWLKK